MQRPSSRRRPRSVSRFLRSRRPILEVLEDRSLPGDTILGGLRLGSAAGAARAAAEAPVAKIQLASFTWKIGSPSEAPGSRVGQTVTPPATFRADLAAATHPMALPAAPAGTSPPLAYVDQSVSNPALLDPLSVDDPFARLPERVPTLRGAGSVGPLSPATVGESGGAAGSPSPGPASPDSPGFAPASPDAAPGANQAMAGALAESAFNAPNGGNPPGPPPNEHPIEIAPEEDCPCNPSTFIQTATNAYPQNPSQDSYAPVRYFDCAPLRNGCRFFPVNR
jgi:hypothetical protein